MIIKRSQGVCFYDLVPVFCFSDKQIPTQNFSVILFERCENQNRDRDPGSWLLAPGSWLLAPGSWLLAPGSHSVWAAEDEAAVRRAREGHAGELRAGAVLRCDVRCVRERERRRDRDR